MKIIILFYKWAVTIYWSIKISVIVQIEYIEWILIDK